MMIWILSYGLSVLLSPLSCLLYNLIGVKIPIAIGSLLLISSTFGVSFCYHETLFVGYFILIAISISIMNFTTLLASYEFYPNHKVAVNCLWHLG